MQWISVEKELPLVDQTENGFIFDSKPVLVWTTNGYYIARYSKRFRSKSGELEFIAEFWDCQYKVSCWANLPEPPK